MTTSRTISKLSKPSGADKIPDTVLAYLQTRNRMHAFSLVLEQFQKAGITKAELAHRLGKGSDRIAHLLGAPGNWTLDTVSDLLFAINGSELDYKCVCPTDKPVRNHVQPDWLHERGTGISINIPEPKDKRINTFIEAGKEVTGKSLVFSL